MCGEAISNRNGPTVSSLLELVVDMSRQRGRRSVRADGIGCRCHLLVPSHSVVAMHPRVWSSLTLSSLSPLHASSPKHVIVSPSYIFLLPRSPLASPARTSQPPSRFTGLLDLHPSVAMGDGLPKKGVGASDHVSLAAELEVFL